MNTLQIETSIPLVLALDAAEATLDQVGGKGASLARLMAAGFPVPPGFHLTTTAYCRFVEANNIESAIAAAVAGVDHNNPATLARASATIQTLFDREAMPDEIATAIRQAYAGLDRNDLAVAVRSSATAEDLPDLSFAGQQETYLNVLGEAALLAAVRRCWASLWTARAIGYRSRMGIDHATIAMGVVVQKMVPAEAAGVLFTANPTTGARDEMVINASFGLGEAVVSGQVTPDTYVVDRTNHALKEIALGAKELMVVPAVDGGTTTQTLADERRSARALSDSLLRDLIELAVRVEQHFGDVPQDIEWTVADGRCWLLQARPITNLPPALLRDVRWEPPTPGSLWVRRQVVEHMPEPLSPLFADLYLAGLDHSVAAMQAAMGVPSAIMDDLFDRPMFATVNGYAYMRGSMNFRWWAPFVLIPAVVVGVSKLLRNAGVVYWQDVLPIYQTTVNRWQELDPTAASDEQLLQGVCQLARADALYWFACTLAVGTAKVTDGLLDHFLTSAAPRRGLSSGLFLRGFPSKTLDAQAELEAIAGRIRGSETLRTLVAATPAARLLELLGDHPGGPSILADLHRYLARYGHQIYSLDFAEPTQTDDPLPVLVGLKGLVQQPGRAVHAHLAEMAREREALVTRTAKSFDPLRRRLFGWLLTQAQHFAPYREEALFYLGAGWPALRRLALELGRRLADIGSLDSPDHVFYLESAALATASVARKGGQALPELARLAREQHNLRETRKRLHPPATVPPTSGWKLGPIDLSSRMSQQHNTDTGVLLRGFAVSPGRVTAPATVILSPADFDKMEPNTILICPTTTPAWTPLFAQARGLVTDIGGVLAHGSIVAREYDIPAVMGTGTATQRIASGQHVTVDGDAGTVTLME